MITGRENAASVDPKERHPNPGRLRNGQARGNDPMLASRVRGSPELART